MEYTLSAEEFKNAGSRKRDMFIKGAPHVHADYMEDEFIEESYTRTRPHPNEGKLKALLQSVFDSTTPPKDMETDSVTKLEVENWLINLQQDQLKNYNIHGVWDQKVFSRMFNLFEEDEEEEGGDEKEEGGLDKGELTKLVKRIAKI